MGNCAAVPVPSNPQILFWGLGLTVVVILFYFLFRSVGFIKARYRCHWRAADEWGRRGCFRCSAALSDRTQAGKASGRCQCRSGCLALPVPLPLVRAGSLGG